jgi:hypothetical protein
MSSPRIALALSFALVLLGACKDRAETTTAPEAVPGETAAAVQPASTEEGTDDGDDAPPTAETEEGSADDDEAAADGSAAPAAPVPGTELADGWKVVSLDMLEGGQMAALAGGRRARAAVGTRLVSGLVGAMEGGPANAIAFCNTAAPGLHSEGLPEGVRLGRTSHALRNPDNAPPEWAEAHVESKSPVPLLARNPDGRIGELTPINTAGICVTCHGPANTLAPEVTASLAELYPEDQATGFVEGGLRGWFWIEVTPG